MRYSAHFTIEELQCPTAKKIVLQDGFIDELEDLRLEYGHGMSVTSGCRSDEHNKWLITRGYKASPHSLHLIGNLKYGTDTCAVDIKRPSGELYHRLLKLALPRGWTVGVAQSFIHLDLRAHYTNWKPIIYTYRS